MKRICLTLNSIFTNHCCLRTVYCNEVAKCAKFRAPGFGLVRLPGPSDLRRYGFLRYLSNQSTIVTMSLLIPPQM